jgi:hypothetical protein
VPAAWTSPSGRAWAIDQFLDKDGEQRRQDLGAGESGEGEPAASAQEEQSDEREPDSTAEPAPEPVEPEREVVSSGVSTWRIASDQLRSMPSGPAGTRRAIRATSASIPPAARRA